MQGSGEALTALSSFGLVALAELGDKSQIVCMTLAARYRPIPVLLGALLAFALLNLLAVLFGATVAEWLPVEVLAVVVGVLFTVFGVQALWQSRQPIDCFDTEVKPGNPLLVTFVLIFVAEFGDKTQLAVAALGGAASPAAVWVGASAALAMTSALAVWVGLRLLQRLSMVWVHRGSGLLFLVLAFVSFAHGLT